MSFIISSCLIESENINFNRVSQTPDQTYKSGISFSYDNYSYETIKDTVWLSNKAYFRLINGRLYQYEVLVDNNVIIPFTSQADDNREFNLDIKDFSKGTHTLQVRQRVKSGTNSLADKLGSEYAEYTSNFALVVSNAVYYTPAFTHLAIEDGTVKMSWTKYPREDFQNYTVVKHFDDGYRKFEVTDRNQTSLIDSSYVGGQIFYELITTNGSNLSSGTYSLIYNYNPVVQLTKISDGNFRLAWTPPTTIAKNVKDYKLIFNSVTYDHLDPNKPYLDINANYSFGNFFNYFIYLNAKVDDSVEKGDNYVVYGTVGVGNRIPSYYDVRHDTQKSSYYLYQTDNYLKQTLYQIDDKDFKVMDSILLPNYSDKVKILISANGQYHYLIGDASYKRFDADNLSILDEGGFLDALPYEAYLAFGHDYFAVTNNNLLLIRTSNYDSSYIIDMNTKNVIFSLKGVGHLSYDGQYLAGEDQGIFTLYTFSANSYIKNVTLPYSNIYYFQFINQHPYQLLIITSTKLIIYDCISQQELFSQPVSIYSGGAHLDQSSSKVYMRSSTGSVAFDLNSKTSKIITTNASLQIDFEGDAAFLHANYSRDGGYVLKNY